MAPEIREALCGLCRGHRWSYGVCWRFDRRDPRLLVMGDSYYEEEIGLAMGKMITQVHLIGEGTIGVAAISGKHQWIHSDTLIAGKAEWQHQFWAGMKTIVIISLPSFGVVQFGSTEKICENLEFINRVRHLLCQRKYLMGNSLDIRDPCEAFSLLVSSGNICSSRRSINSLHDLITKELQDNAEPSTSYLQSSNPFNLGSHVGSLTPHPSVIPIISNPTGVSVSVSNPFLRTPSANGISSFQGTRQGLASCAETQVLLLPNNNMKFSYSFPSNPFSTNLNVNSWAKEIATPPLLPGSATTTLSSASRMNLSQYSCGNSISFHGQGGSGKLVDSLSSSPAKSSSKSSKSSPIASEPSDNFLTFPQDSTPEHSALFQFKDDQTSNQIDQCDQPSVQVTDSATLTTKDNITSVQSEAISCSPSTELPCKPVEISGSTACDWKDSSSNGPSQLLDIDLFEGMELDLSPGILRQDCWDDIIMPVNCNSCSNLSTSVSNCISDMDIGSLAAADKGLFSGPSFEQLLETVVQESANLPTSHSSIPVNVNVGSVASLDFDHHVATVSNTKLAPPADFNLEKIIQESSKEALPKSHVSSWIDDTCTVNAERAETNQPKKPEETPKVVRKRARPGESTRPRPKDRQQIQDRVKELREIVPNGAKCSIDSLLDRTIKHILFLQSVTKYADKLKQTDEPKMIGEESGVVLKDNSGSCDGGGGATWAYEVAGQTMVCPILVEDLNPPGQMLVEMLCEERGFFLEIADIIRGFGLTILKGVMEIRDSKIWARFLVEANRDVTRMDVFLSLVQLLQQTSSINRTNEQQTKALDKGVSNTFTNYRQPQVPIPISLANRSQ